MDDKFRVDSTKLHFHPRRVVQLLNGRDNWEAAKEIYPIYVEVSPAGVCSHACTFCGIDYVLDHNKQLLKYPMLDHAIFAERIAEMSALGVKSVMFAGEGEPLLHKQINVMVSAALNADIDVAFTTNGVLLDRLDLNFLSWVKVSINAGTPETYAQVHRAAARDWGRVWGNLRNAVQLKGACTLGVQMVLLPENAGEVQALYDLCDDAGVDYLVVKPYSQHKSSLTHEYEHAEPPAPAIVKRNTQFIWRASAAATHEIPYSKCLATPYLWAYIMASGDVYSCSAYLLDERFRLGNIGEQTFAEIWQGERRRANWELVGQHLDIGECRVNCRMHQSNLYLHDVIQGVSHGNFI